MGIVTDITKQKRNKTRVNIFIDNEFVCGLDEIAVASARIKIGDELSPEALKKLTVSSELNSAFERAVGYLSLAPRARGEIEKYLRDKGYDREVVSQTLDKLDGYHYIDDRAYAESYIKSKSKKYGSFRLQAELKKKGIAPEIISELLEDGGNDGAYGVACKYLKSHRTGDKQKLKRFLAGRGFSWDSINAVVSRLSDEGACDGDGGDDYYED
ncbi:MAG: hypothetical protein HDT28_02965 [Clostridiales bacterium]|nr:hypothetical protein [Clostridiales bacterium]